MKQCISLFIDFKKAYETHAKELSKPEFTRHHRTKKGIHTPSFSPLEDCHTLGNNTISIHLRKT
jgi:hypothetical protein